MLLKISIPSFRKVETEQDKSYTVFLVEVHALGRRNVVEKRYSEFESLHKRIRKNIRAPEFPPKKVMNKNPKVLEQRRLALEAYLQGVIERGSVPKSFLKFFGITADIENIDSIEVIGDNGTTHQPVLAFSEDVYLAERKDSMADIIGSGVLSGFYGSSTDVR